MRAVLVVLVGLALSVSAGSAAESEADGLQRVTNMDAFDTVVAAHEAHVHALLQRPGVVGVGIGVQEKNSEETGRLAVIVSVVEKKSLEQLRLEGVEPLPTALAEGVPIDVQVLEGEFTRRGVEGPFFRSEGSSSGEDDEKYSVLKGGIGFGTCENDFHGTLGAIVTDGNKKYALTNEHVVTTKAKDKRVAQPHPATGMFTFCWRDTIGEYVKGEEGSKIDAALVELNDKRPTECSVQDIGPLRGSNRDEKTYLNAEIRKRGRTTRLTYGYVRQIRYSGKVSGTRVVNQILLANSKKHPDQKILSQQGDSGSVYVDQNNKVIGLHRADNGQEGSSQRALGAPIDPVLQIIGVEICRKD